jgi:hypothetical protein
MAWIALLLFLSTPPPAGRSTSTVEAVIVCLEQPDKASIAIRREPESEKTDSPYELTKNAGGFGGTIPDFAITVKMPASLRLKGMRTDCRNPKIKSDHVAYYIFGCAKEARNLVVTPDPPDLSFVYARRLKGGIPDYDCYERGRITGETPISDVGILEDLVIQFGTARPHAPGVNPKKIPWRLKSRGAAKAPAGKGGAPRSKRGNLEEPEILDIDAVTLDRIQFQAELVRQIAFDTGYLSSIEFDYAGEALKNFKRITIGPAVEPTK